ncbi:hypothetical protein T4D_15427 [Trichinella pseudospiralis]|uniref:Uncharacterized protein n=1 Tax=Trichinella pseudospiralis TaxID=6337 RepID=A0A0V1FRV2_TRIPS|nr:hypothetical protein T4D_15427 [Trichinella pseudospiralis]
MDQNKPIPQMEILDTAEGGHVAVQWEPAQQLDGAFGKLCTYKFHASPLKCILELAQRRYVLTGNKSSYRMFSWYDIGFFISSLKHSALVSLVEP